MAAKKCLFAIFTTTTKRWQPFSLSPAWYFMYKYKYEEVGYLGSHYLTLWIFVQLPQARLDLLFDFCMYTCIHVCVNLLGSWLVEKLYTGFAVFLHEHTSGLHHFLIHFYNNNKNHVKYKFLLSPRRREINADLIC